MDIAYLNLLRRSEMDEVLPLLPAGARILEFGSGTGEQARYLADCGFDVVAIDLATSNYADERVYPIRNYDGRHIPLEDGSVDVIFSSNVLEHVENLGEICAEFRRVLRPRGVAVHVLPTTLWRFWSLVTGATASLIAAVELPACLFRKPAEDGRGRVIVRQLRRVASGFVPKPHGTASNGITELWDFSREAWQRKFKKYGFKIVDDRPVGFFYSGTVLFGGRLSMAERKKLSRFLGSSTRVYVTAPDAASGVH